MTCHQHSFRCNDKNANAAVVSLWLLLQCGSLGLRSGGDVLIAIAKLTPLNPCPPGMSQSLSIRPSCVQQILLRHGTVVQRLTDL